MSTTDASSKLVRIPEPIWRFLQLLKLEHGGEDLGEYVRQAVEFADREGLWKQEPRTRTSEYRKLVR